MYQYKFVMKSGKVSFVNTKWIELSTINGMLDSHSPFIMVGDKVFAKDDISTIEEIKTTEE